MVILVKETWRFEMDASTQHLGKRVPGDRLGQRVWGFRFWWAASSGFFFERNKRSSSSTNKNPDSTSFFSKLGIWCTCICWVLYIKKLSLMYLPEMIVTMLVILYYSIPKSKYLIIQAQGGDPTKWVETKLERREPKRGLGAFWGMQQALIPPHPAACRLRRPVVGVPEKGASGGDHEDVLFTKAVSWITKRSVLTTVEWKNLKLCLLQGGRCFLSGI